MQLAMDTRAIDELQKALRLTALIAWPIITWPVCMPAVATVP